MAIGETESIREAREKKQDASNRRADAAAGKDPKR